jgi:uncharacterized protein (DUF58 family)
MYRQQTSIPVLILLDLSASMGFGGASSRLLQFISATAYSAFRSGDPFGLFCCDEALRHDLSLPLRNYKSLPADLVERLFHHRPHGRNAHGLSKISAQLGRQRVLLFLVSDFHFPLEETASLLESLAAHDVAPIVIWDPREFQGLPDWGWVELRDAENGSRRRWFLRPSLKRRIEEGFLQRREQLRATCLAFGREPFFMADEFQGSQLTDYFYRS